MNNTGKKGFTLLEVLTVVVIAALVTMLAVPAYKKQQDKNRYMAASGVLIDLGNGVRMLQEEYPNIPSLTQTITAAPTIISSGADEAPTDANALFNWLYTNKYVNSFPIDNVAHTYMGYSFKIYTGGTATCGACSGSDSVACMSGSNLNAQYTCAWVDKSGNLHHNS